MYFVIYFFIKLPILLITLNYIFINIFLVKYIIYLHIKIKCNLHLMICV